MKLTYAQCQARYEAYAEAATHLQEGGWCGDETERQEGLVVAKKLEKKAAFWLEKTKRQGYRTEII